MLTKFFTALVITSLFGGAILREPDVPCPDIFRYVTNTSSGESYGEITLPGSLHDFKQKDLVIQLRMTLVAAKALPPVGLQITMTSSFDNLLQGKSSTYAVRFPYRKQLPRLLDLKVDNKLVCFNTPQSVDRRYVVTTLEKTLRIRKTEIDTSGSAYQHGLPPEIDDNIFDPLDPNEVEITTAVSSLAPRPTPPSTRPSTRSSTPRTTSRPEIDPPSTGDVQENKIEQSLNYNICRILIGIMNIPITGMLLFVMDILRLLPKTEIREWVLQFIPTMPKVVTTIFKHLGSIFYILRLFKHEKSLLVIEAIQNLSTIFNWSINLLKRQPKFFIISCIIDFVIFNLNVLKWLVDLLKNVVKIIAENCPFM